MDRFVLISADCHAVGRPDDFRPFIESQYLDAFDDENRKRIELAREARKASEDGGLLFSREALEEYQSHEATEEDVIGGTAGQWDSDRRIQELEDDGVVAEVVFPNGGPFVTGRGGAPVPAELRTAGLGAYNRWLADFCAQAPGRRAGIAQLPIHDVELSIAEVERAAAAGLKGVSVPLLFDDPGAPPLYHERYEAMWAACAANRLPVHVHGGAGPDYGGGIDTLTRIMLYVTEVPLWPRRMFYFLLWNGVLERHPDLQLVFTEGTCDWVPTVVSYLDYLYESKDFAHIRQVLPKTPSEYWARQCYVGSSSVSRAETDMRYEIGVDCMMFGSDYPHVEGTWPRTFDWVAATLGGIPAPEQRKILGGNAARLYGFDLDLLEPIAQRVGIPVAELAERREVPALAHTQVDRPGTMLSHNFLQISKAKYNSGDQVDDSKLERWGAWAGIAFVVLVLITAFLPGSPPKPSDSAVKITKYFVDKSDEIRITTYVGGLATIAILFWLGALWRFMRTAEGEGPMLATSAVAAGTVAAALNAVSGIIFGTVAILHLQKGIESGGIRFFYVLGNNFAVAGGFAVIVMLAAVSFLVLRSNLMPKWVAALGGITIVAWIVAGGGVTSTKDFLLYVLFAAFLLFAVWIVVVSVMMLRAAGTGKATASAPAVSEPLAA